ncbi:HIT-like protein [Salinivirga cyanobacteriivorans]|uniref:HIT-like protein n=1 Tax=Salinivirga cyanobacteriivorans TaxID=1307839 RepID=A0A0S2I196_9BACT|nr:HIT family protein [Salinivirga cyanobacteriivorans]ALO16068.1 HIT-like protein [Salinivirga cyanobacteriivorans]
METIFSKIVKGDIPSHKVYEDDNFLAFLDIAPLKKGHTLVIPKRTEDYLFDLDDSELAEMMIVSKKVAKAIKKVFPCEKVGVAVLGLEVPHAHIHLVPLESEQDINFANPKLQLSQEEMADIAAKLQAQV